MAFATTRWSLVIEAGRDAGSALADLVATYWYPLYAFARRRGTGADEAQDLVQGFFAALIEKRFLLAADPERGRFRTFLLTAFKRYAATEWERRRAHKRGGDRLHVSLDFEAGEARYRLEPTDDLTPERLYARRFALTLLQRVMDDLRREYGRREESERFEELCPYLPGGPPGDRAAAAARLGLTPEAFRVALHRLRGRYRRHLEAAIRETVADPADVAAEIRDLLDALA